MQATCYEVPCASASIEGSFLFEMRFVEERRVDVTVVRREDGSSEPITGSLRTDPTTLYNVIHGWPIELRDDRGGELHFSEMNGVVKVRYDRSQDNLRFESRIGSEDFARRVHALGGPTLV